MLKEVAFMEKHQGKAIRKKLSRPAIIIMGAVLLAVSFSMLIKNVNKQIVASNIESMEELALHDSNSIKNSIELRFDNLEAVSARLREEEISNIEELSDALYSLIRHVPSADKLALLDSEGTLYLSTGLIQKNSKMPEIIGSRTDCFVSRMNSDSFFVDNGRELLVQAIPVDFSICGNEMKWLVCQYPISSLEDELKIDSYNNNGFSSVIDYDGNYIINISRSHSVLTYDNFFHDLQNAVFEGFSDIDALRAATTTTTTGATSVVYTKDGQENIMVITAIDFAD